MVVLEKIPHLERIILIHKRVLDFVIEKDLRLFSVE
jgi:hypothetical protein